MTSILFKIVRIYNSKFKCNYLKNENFFGNFLLHCWNLHQFLNILEEKMFVMANVFPKLETVNILFRPVSKKRRFRTSLESQHVKAFQIHANSPWEHFDHVFSSFSGKLVWKMSPLVLGEVIVLFVNNWLRMASVLFKIGRICK